MQTLIDLIATLPSHGDKAAIVQTHSDGSQLLTYETLASDVGRYAAGLQTAGMQAGDYVLFFAGGGPDWITAFLSVVAVGGVPVPLDVQTDDETLAHVLDHSSAKWAVVDSERNDALADVSFAGKKIHLDNSAAKEHNWRDLKSAQPIESMAATSPDDTAILFYTSGTTGRPKGVPLKHRHVAFQAKCIAESGLVAADDRILQPLPPHHVYPLVVGTVTLLSLGVTMVIPEAMLGPQIVAALQAENVSLILGVPRLYEAMVAAIESRIAAQKGLAGLYLRSGLGISRWLRRRFGWYAGRKLLFPLHRRLAPSLRVLASGGAALDPALALRIESLGWQIAIGYGLTETSSLLTINPPGSGRLDSVGRAVPGIELRIDSGAAIPAEERPSEEGPADGEILARGECVFDGYFKLERNAEAFTEDGWFRTADLGKIGDDGFVTITGRRNTLLVTSSGKNIQPDEIEHIYARHELIEEIGILMDRQQLVAVVVPLMPKVREKNVSPENAVKLAIAEQAHELASYKRVTKHVLSRDPLPRTRLGKIQRHKLAKLYATLLAHPDHQAPRSAPMPIDEMPRPDKKLLENEQANAVWQLLSRRFHQHGLTPDSNLQLDLGIDSLAWLELGTAISHEVGINLDEDRIADIESVRDLLTASAESAADATIQETPIANPDAYISDQQRQWLAPLGTGSRRTADLGYSTVRGGMRMLFKLRVAGTEHLPANSRWIIAPNHVSFLDAFAVAAALPKAAIADTFWAGWTGYAFRNILFRRLSRLAQIIPIDPERAASSSLALAAAVLGNDKHLVIFPEGERSATGELLNLKPGVGLLAAHFSDAAVIPTWIAGSFEAWPRDRRLPRPKPITVVFGAPLDSTALASSDGYGSAADKITAGLLDALERLSRSHQIRDPDP